MSAAGKYREKVKLYTPATLVQNSVGGYTETEQLLAELWADVKQLQAKEVLENGGLKYKQVYKITIRYNKYATHVQRVGWNDLTIAVNSVVHDIRKTETVLYGFGTNIN